MTEFHKMAVVFVQRIEAIEALSLTLTVTKFNPCEFNACESRVMIVFSAMGFFKNN